MSSPCSGQLSLFLTLAALAVNVGVLAGKERADRGGDVWEQLQSRTPIWGFPKIGGTILGVPIIRTIIF